MIKVFRKVQKYWKAGFSYGFKLSHSLAGPINVHIETTNLCNFKCIYCQQSNPDQHFLLLGKGKMSFENFKIILDKITNTWPLEELILTRDGEPLIHPELENFIIYSVDKGLKVSLGSNGSYFSKEKAAKLIESGLTKIKGDFCTNKEQFEKLRMGGKWETVLQGYRNILDCAIENKKNFHLALVDLNTYYTKSQDEAIQSIGEMKKLFPYSEKYLSINHAIMHNSFNQAQVILSTSKKRERSKYNLCHHPWVELVIDYKGNAVGCCRDLRSEYILGNVLECRDIERDIWNGERMQYLRNKLAKKSPESISICMKCDLPYGVSYAGSTIINKMIRFFSR
jgi:radical SAM protein with 4Fe4S-binding SPASM domain